MFNVSVKMGQAAFERTGVVFDGAVNNVRGSEILPHCQAMSKSNRYGPRHMLGDINDLLTDAGIHVFTSVGAVL